MIVRYLALTDPAATLTQFEVYLASAAPALVPLIQAQMHQYEDGSYHLKPEDKTYSDQWESIVYTSVPLSALGLPVPNTAQWSCQLRYFPATTRPVWGSDPEDENPTMVGVPAQAEFIEFTRPAHWLAQIPTGLIDGYIDQFPDTDWVVDPLIVADGGPATVPAKYNSAGGWYFPTVNNPVRSYS